MTVTDACYHEGMSNRLVAGEIAGAAVSFELPVGFTLPVGITTAFAGSVA